MFYGRWRFCFGYFMFFCNYRDVIYVAESVCTPFYVFRYIRGLSLISRLTLHAYSVNLVRQEPGKGRPLAGNHLELGTATLGAARAGSFFRCATVALFHLYGVFVFLIYTIVIFFFTKSGIVEYIFLPEVLSKYNSIFKCFFISIVFLSVFIKKFICFFKIRIFLLFVK